MLEMHDRLLGITIVVGAGLKRLAFPSVETNDGNVPLQGILWIARSTVIAKPTI